MHLKSFCLDVGNREDGNACLVLKAWQKIGVTFDSRELADYIFDQGRNKAPVAEEYLFAQNWGKIFQRCKTGHCKDTESNLERFASF